MTPERIAKFKRVVDQRQHDLTVILEDVHDPHNISAVIRTCDSVGIKEIYVLYTATDLERLKLGKRSSASARKWVDVHFFKDRDKCFQAVRKKYDRILATHLSSDSVSIYDVSLTGSLAILLGNEKDGVSDESLEFCDGNILIPQVGMIESLNISVAGAVILYECFRQKLINGDYAESGFLTAEQKMLFEEYVNRTKTGRIEDVEDDN